MFSGYIKAAISSRSIKRDIEFTAHCLAMNLEKRMAIDEALLDELISISPVGSQNTKIEIQ
jgi:hypothetical protein